MKGPTGLDYFDRPMLHRLNELMFELFDDHVNGQLPQLELRTFLPLLRERAQREWPGLTPEQFEKAQQDFIDMVIRDLTVPYARLDAYRPYRPGVNQCPNCNVGGCQGCDGHGGSMEARW